MQTIIPQATVPTDDKTKYIFDTEYEPDAIIGNVLLPGGINDVTVSQQETSMPMQVPPLGVNTVLQSGIREQTIVITTMFPQELVSAQPVYGKMVYHTDYYFLLDLFSLISLQKVFPIVPVYSKPLQRLVGLYSKEDDDKTMMSSPSDFAFFQQIQSVNISMSSQTPNLYKVTIQMLPQQVGPADFRMKDYSFVDYKNDGQQIMVAHFFLSKYIRDLVVSYRESANIVGQTNNITLSLNREYIEKVLARYLIYQLAPLIPQSEISDTDEISLDTILENLKKANVSNVSVTQFINEIESALNSVEGLEHNSVTMPSDVQKIELSMQFTNSFAVHNNEENDFPFRQYLGTSNWSGQLVMQLDGQDEQSMDQLSKLTTLQNNIQQFIRNQKNVVPLQPLTVTAPFLNQFGIDKIYTNGLDIKSVEDAVSHFIVNVPFTQIDNVTKLLLAKVMTTSSSYAKDLVDKLTKETQAFFKDYEQLKDVSLDQLQRSIQQTKISEFIQQNELDKIFSKISEDFKMQLQEMMLGKTLLSHQQYVAIQASASGVITYTDLELFKTSFLPRNDQIPQILSNNNNNDLSVRAQAGLYTYLTSKTVESLDSFVKQATWDGFIQSITDYQELTKNDLATIFAQCKVLDPTRDNNQKYSGRLYTLVGQYLTTQHNALLSEYSDWTVLPSNQDSLVVFGNKAYDIFNAFVLDVMSSTVASPAVNQQLVTQSEYISSVIDVLASAKPPSLSNLTDFPNYGEMLKSTNPPKLSVPSSLCIKEIKGKIYLMLQFLYTIKHSAEMFNEIQLDVALAPKIKLERIYSILLAIFKSSLLWSMFLAYHLSINLDDVFNDLREHVKTESDIRSLLKDFMPNYMAETLAKHIYNFLNATENDLEEWYEKFLDNPALQLRDPEIISLQACARFASNFVDILNNISNGENGAQLLYNYLSYNVEPYFWLDIAGGINDLFSILLQTIIENMIRKDVEQFTRHEVAGYPIIDFSTVYIPNTTQFDTKLAQNIAIQSNNQHINVINALTEFMKSSSAGRLGDQELQDFVAYFYGSYPQTKQFASWHLNLNVAKALELSASAQIAKLNGQNVESDKIDLTKVVSTLSPMMEKEAVSTAQGTKITNTPVSGRQLNGAIGSISGVEQIQNDDQIKTEIQKLDEQLRKALAEEGEATSDTLNTCIKNITDLIEQGSQSPAISAYQDVIDTLNEFVTNKTEFTTMLASSYLSATMLQQMTDMVYDTKRLQARQALILVVKADNGDKQQYVYDQVMSFNVVKEKDNPVDVQTIVVPDSGLLFSNFSLPGFINTQSMLQPINILLQPGVDVELRVGHSRKLSDMDKIFAGFIRDVQKQNGTITIIAEGYGQVLTRPIFEHSKHFSGQFSEPRKYVVHQLQKQQSEQLGYRNFKTDPVSRFLETLSKDYYQLQADDKIFLQQLTTQPFSTNLYYPSSYWTGIRSGTNFDPKLYFENFEMHFNGYDIKAGYSAWDVIEDQTTLSPDFIAQVEPINELGQARVFFGKPEWPFHYESNTKQLNVSLSQAYQNMQNMYNYVNKLCDQILKAIDVFQTSVLPSGIKASLMLNQQLKLSHNLFVDRAAKLLETSSNTISKFVEFIENPIHIQALEDEQLLSKLQYHIKHGTNSQIAMNIQSVYNKLQTIQRLQNEQPQAVVSNSINSNLWPLLRNFSNELNSWESAQSMKLTNGKTLGVYRDEVVGAIENMTAQNYGTVTFQIGQFIQTANHTLDIYEREAEVKLSRLFYNDTINNNQWSALQDSLDKMYHIQSITQEILANYQQRLKIVLKRKDVQSLSPHFDKQLQMFARQENVRAQITNAICQAINNWLLAIQWYDQQHGTSNQTVSDDQVEGIKQMYDRLIQYYAESNLMNTTKLFNFGRRGILDELNVKLYPTGTKPFENYHYINDSMVIANNISLNPEVQNKVILYSPTFMENAWFIPFKLGKILEALIPFISSGYENINGMHMMVTEQVFDEDIPPDKTVAKTITTHFGTVPQARIIIQSSHLKKALEEMYLGQVVIPGKANIKPYDIIFLTNTNKGFIGFQRVHTVTHMYGLDTGYITAIRVMPIVEFKDVHHKVMAYTLYQLVNYQQGFIFAGALIKNITTLNLPTGTLKEVLGRLTKETGVIQKNMVMNKTLRRILSTKTIISSLGLGSYIQQIPQMFTAVKEPDQNTPALVQHDKVVNPLNITLLTLNGRIYQAGLTGSVVDKYNYVAEQARSVMINFTIFGDFLSKVFNDKTYKQFWNDVMIGVGVNMINLR